MGTIEFICLANSRKHGGRCVAGLRTDGGGWVRLVAPTPDGALTCVDYRLPNGDEARPLDVLRVAVTEPRPAPHQPENWLIADRPWELVRRPAASADWRIVEAAIAAGPELLRGTATALPFNDFARQPMSASLALVAAKRPVLHVSHVRERLRLRLSFSLAEARYTLTCTDPLWETALAKRSTSDYRWRDIMPKSETPLVTISLTEPFGDPAECFKIAATILPSPLPAQSPNMPSREPRHVAIRSPSPNAAKPQYRKWPGGNHERVAPGPRREKSD